MGLANKGLLVSVSVACWHGRKFDKVATRTSEQAHATETGTVSVSKKLLPGSKALAEVVRLQNHIGKWTRENSLPWATEGSRVIASREYLNFVSEFRQLKIQFDNAVEQFLVEYPSLRTQARVALGGLFQESEYPDPARLARKFSAQISFRPIPTVDDFRVELDADSKAEFERENAELEANVLRNCWKQLFEVVSKAAQTLQSPDAKYRDSLIENIGETCKLLGKLNVTEDPELDKARADIARIAQTISPDLCRQSPNDRAKAAQTLADIQAKLGAFAPQTEGE